MRRQEAIDVGLAVTGEHLLHHQIERGGAHRDEQFVLLDLDPMAHARAFERIARAQARLRLKVVQEFVDDR